MFIAVKHSDIPVKKITEDYFDSINNPDHHQGVSIGIIEATNETRKEKSSYHCIYYIFDGELCLVINNKRTVLQKKDAFFVEKGTEFEIKGTFKAMRIHKVLSRS